MSASASRPTAVGFLLSDDVEAARRFLLRCRSHDYHPVLVRAGYEIEPPADIDGVAVRPPVHYLTPDDLDAVHEDVLGWLKRLPSTRLDSGQTLADWEAGRDHPAPVWSWLGHLAPYIQMSLRTIRLVASVARAEAPAAWAFIGDSADVGWQGPLIRQAMTDQAPSAATWSDQTPRLHEGESAHGHAGRLPWLRFAPLLLVRLTGPYRQASAHLAASDAAARAPLPLHKNHVVLISRGQRGAHWLQSHARGRPVLIDEYSEGLPDALAEACALANCRMTIVWEGPRPTADGAGYAERWPNHVAEITSADFTPFGAALRPAIKARYRHAIQRLIRDPGFQAAFRLDGVDVFGPLAGHFVPSLTDLAVLSTTQTDAWRQVLQALQPDVVVGGRLESRPWINFAAAAAGARTASVKLGIGDEMSLSLMAVRPDGRHEARSNPDALLLWGEHQVEHIARRLPENTFDLQAVGRMRSDTFVNESSAGGIDAAAVRARLGLGASGPIIVWGGTARSRWGLLPGQTSGGAVMAPESWRACLVELCKVARDLRGQVLVKPHPADDRAFVAREIARMDSSICVLASAEANVHNYQLLGVTDVFVSSVSSMFAEAVLAGKAAVNVWTPDIGMIYEQARFALYSSIAVPARSALEAGTVVRHLLTDASALAAEHRRARAGMSRYFGGTDGQNANRAAEWIIASIAESRPPR